MPTRTVRMRIIMDEGQKKSPAKLLRFWLRDGSRYIIVSMDIDSLQKWLLPFGPRLPNAPVVQLFPRVTVQH